MSTTLNINDGQKKVDRRQAASVELRASAMKELSLQNMRIVHSGDDWDHPRNPCAKVCFKFSARARISGRAAGGRR